MEAVQRRQSWQQRRESTRQGDWVCNYCHNYNYAFRTTCNRCRYQTRDKNNQENAMLVYHFAQVETCTISRSSGDDDENDDPGLDDNFPKLLYVSVPKSYGQTAKELIERSRTSSYNNLVLSQADINQSKKQTKIRDETFEKENIRWLNKIIEQ